MSTYTRVRIARLFNAAQMRRLTHARARAVERMCREPVPVSRERRLRLVETRRD